jgi:enediyne biosynthesis protein E4
MRRAGRPIALALVAGLLGGCGTGAGSPGLERPREPGPKPKVLDAVPLIVPDRPAGSPAAIRFRDVTDASGIDFIHVSGNSPEKYFPTSNGSGVAMIDYDGDGRLDLYFATTRELPLDGPTRSKGNRLYRNLGGGKFEDVTDAAGVGYKGFTHGLAVGDVDNDGHPDLFLANLGPNVLYLNNGDGTFRDATAGSGLAGPPWSLAAAFFDYDGDGLLDLYVSCYGRWTLEEEHRYCGSPEKKVRTFCSPLEMPPTRHYLYRNLGGGRFEETTAKAGVLRHDGRGMGVLAVDVNGDGKLDLYVANDLCPKFLFLNRGDGTFEDISESSGAAVTEAGANQAGMGLDAEDVDGDGLFDLFATHFRADYNTLYRNLDGRHFQDVSAGAGIVADSKQGVNWGCALADFDLDGRPDMLVVSGHVDDNLPQLGQDVPYAEYSKVWRNEGGGKYRLVRDPGPFFAVPHVARGAAFGDLDDDGDTDVVVSLMDARPAVLLNESDRGHWVRLELVGTHSNRSAIGAAVAVYAGGRVLHRQVKGGGSYCSANDTRLSIGLGAATRVERVEIRWPRGARTVLKDVPIDRAHRVEEPRGAEGAR